MLTPQVTPPFPLHWGFSTKLDPPADLPLLRLSQVHGCGLVEAPGLGSQGIQEADGIWTTTAGVCIGVRVADCVPILMAGLVVGKPWAAVLHAGWRGAVAGIFRRGIDLFQAQGGEVEMLTWALGPSIQQCHFEVGEEVIDAARLDPAWHPSLSAAGPRGRPHLDLPGFLRAQGVHLGLSPSREGSVNLCTVCQEQLLWSFRRGDRFERQWGWIEIG